MNVEQLRKVHQAIPFQPFVLHIADGRKIHVPHPEFVAQFPSGRAIIVTHSDESWELIDLTLVTSMKVGGGTNKKRPRKKK